MTDVSFNSIKVELEDKLQHPYLKKFIKKPVINNDKLVILYNLIEQTSYSEEKKKNYILTTMLVQIALDTHDLVSEKHDQESKQTTKSRQLTVLAGDYFSGIYYYMLSKLEDIAMIATLASTIKEINEIKMTLFYEKKQSLNDWVDGVKALESILIVRVANHINNPSIDSFIQQWLLTKRLLQEKTAFLTKQHSPLFELFIEQLSKEQVIANQLLETIESTIHKHFLLSKELFYNVPTQFQFLKTYAQSFFIKDSNHYKLSVEEG
ncbi:heptaprenyl diphosphate synthase component 1 [Paraliobacillus sp. JSM ZJ581]|uniref:heptaprenyl diphosphate synthase component 1 n=1 Tax=Paraliobacillus sp. JSM ZJ581 TaxID=3342118 RepID=UPI0035A8FBFC